MCNDEKTQPYQGVTSTPVIDPSTNTIYVVSAQTLSGNSTFRLSALDITITMVLSWFGYGLMQAIIAGVVFAKVNP